MHYAAWYRRVALAGAVAAAGLVASEPAGAQSAARKSAAAAAPVAAPPACVIPQDFARFDLPLRRTVRRLAAGKPVKIVAIGSSSTYGAGASKPGHSYPSRLAAELSRAFADGKFTVLNRGVNGDTATGMLARFQRSVIAEEPDLVLWQVGTNSLLRGDPVQPQRSLLHGGIVRLKATSADIVLIDPQYAPRVLARPNVAHMITLLAHTARAESVNLFRRFALMRHWHQVEKLPFDAFLSPDQLHMNDFSYACVARALGGAIAEALTRPVATASAPNGKR